MDWLGDLVPELPLPLMLYSIPSLTKVIIEPETVERGMDFEEIIAALCIGPGADGQTALWVNDIATGVPRTSRWSLETH